jgi:Putative beta-barrel porin 2
MGADGASWAYRILVTSGCAALLYVGISSDSRAQIGSIGGGGGPSLEPPAVASGRADVFARPERADTALIAGEWVLYPSAFGGAVYDSNVNQSATGSVSRTGLRLVPSLLAQTNTGVSKTTLFGMADGRLYFNLGATNSDAISVRSGVLELYQPLPDLLFTGQSDFMRQKDVFSTLGITNNLSALNTTAIGLAPTVNPQAYNQLSGVVSVQKNFASAFAILSASVVDQMFDNSSGVVAPSSDGVVYTGTGRGGIWITPSLYGYVEGSLDTRDYATRSLNSSGYRVVGGLGTDRIGLLKGEAYAGYQSETYKAAGIGTSGSAVFGGRVEYFPLPELTMNFSADETLGASLLAMTPTSPAGTSTRLTKVLGTAHYSIAPEWEASGRVGYIHTDYGGNVRRDNAWTIGTTFGYYFERNVGLSLDYQHIGLTSNVAFQSFSRDVITLGISYKY